MVVSRKPKPKPVRRKRETLEQKFDRIRAEPIGTPIPKLTKREARYFLTRLAGSDPNARTSTEILHDFWGDWEDDEVVAD